MGKYFLGLCLTWFFFSPVTAFSYENEQDMAVHYLQRAKLLYDRSEYDSLPYYYSFSEEIFERLELYERAADCKLGMVDYYRIMNRQSDANLNLKQAETYILENIGRDTDTWANALYIRGKLLHGQVRTEEAIRVLNSCLDLEKNLGWRPEKSARIYNVLGAVYYTFGDLDSAEFFYKIAFNTYTEISSEPTVDKGMVLHNLGLIYSQSNNKEKWAEYATRSLENNILVFGPGFPDLAGIYNSLASYFIVSGRMDSADLYLDKAESILINAYGDDYFELNRIYINRARLYRYEGNYQASLEYYLQASNINEQQEIPNRRLRNTIYVNIGQLYKALGDYQTAYHYFAKLLASRGEVHPTRMASYYAHLADILIYMGKYSESELYLQKIFDLREEHFPEEYYGLSFDYQIYGVLLDSIGRESEAKDYLYRALKHTLQNYGDHHYRTARIYKTLGDHCLGVNAYEEALNNYQNSILALVPEYRILEVEHNPDPEIIPDLMFYLRLLKQKAATLEFLATENRDNPDTQEFFRAAYLTYNVSVRVTEILRNSYLNDESKLYLSENERSTYEKGVQTAYKCFEISADPAYLINAFKIAEKGKYATLQSLIAREEALELSGIPDSILEIESGFQKQLAVYQELLNESLDDTLSDQVMLEQYRSELFRLKDQLASLHRSLESEYPDYYNLLYHSEVVDNEKLAKSLGRKEKIIEYFFASRELYIFEISREEFTCRKETVDSLFHYDLDLVARYISRHSDRDSIQYEHLSFIESSSRLYGKLIPPGNDSRNLIIIPEGKLSYLPFDILITEPVPKFSGLYRDVPFLIRTHSIRYGYAAGLLSSGNHRNPGNLNSYIGFAPGYLTGADQGANSDIQRDIKIDRHLLDALPGSIDEVNEIGELLGGISLTGENASEQQFKQLAGESYIIHLATHAFLDDQDPLKSKLVFAKDQESGYDGLLNVYELYNMDLQAGMVVLSACNTGTGEMKSGEGIMSLARGFFYAGVPNIVMTLWTVSDRQSYKLMLSFYDNLKKGRRAEVSLRKAKLDFLDNSLPGYQNPKYWAGYILVGDPGYLFFPYHYRKLSVAAGVILLLLSGMILIKRLIGK